MEKIGYEWLDLAYEPEATEGGYLQYQDYPKGPIVTEAGERKLVELNGSE
jgi:hypothetical protein